MDIVSLIKNVFIPNLEAYGKRNLLQLDEKYMEERAFFYKIVGDYYRYASEAVTVRSPGPNSGSVPGTGNEDDGTAKREFFKQGALEAYNKCNNMSKRGLKPYNFVRLGLALNFSVFQFEIM